MQRAQHQPGSRPVGFGAGQFVELGNRVDIALARAQCPRIGEPDGAVRLRLQALPNPGLGGGLTADRLDGEQQRRVGGGIAGVRLLRQFEGAGCIARCQPGTAARDLHGGPGFACGKGFERLVEQPCRRDRVGIAGEQLRQRRDQCRRVAAVATARAMSARARPDRAIG